MSDSEKIGTKLPDANFLYFDKDGPGSISISDMSKGRNIVIFALPGAFTRTCSATHLPGYIQAADEIRKAGIDEIYCISVNDVFVLAAWSEQSGAGDAGISILADADASFTKAMGMDFSAPPVGLIDRSKRYALIARDGVIKGFEAESDPGQCTISAAANLLELLKASV